MYATIPKHVQLILFYYSTLKLDKADVYTRGVLDRLTHTHKLHKLADKHVLPTISKSAKPYTTQYTKVNITDEIIPTVYLCATMWHENTAEMRQLLTSAFRYAVICNFVQILTGFQYLLDE